MTDEHTPSNARWLVVSKTSDKLGDLLVDAKTIVPWLMLTAGAPPGMVGLLVPLRESLSMLPQAFIAPWVQAVEPRKRMAIAALLAQAVGALAIAVVTYSLRGFAAGVGVLLALCLLTACTVLTSLGALGCLALRQA